MMKAPFKRGQILTWTCPKHGDKVKVKYVKWWGIMRSSLIVVRFPSDVHGVCREITVHVDEVKPT